MLVRLSLASHQSSDWSSVSPVTVRACRLSRPMRRRCSSTSGTPPARNTCTVGWFCGPLGSASTSRGVARLTRCQSATVGRAEAGGVRDGGKVQHEVRRAAEGGVGQHRVLDRLRREHAPQRNPERREPQEGEGRAAGHVQPDGLAGGGEGAVGERKAQRLGHDLRGRRRAQELAAAAGRAAGATGELGRLLQGHEPVGEARSERLHRARVLAAGRGQRDAAGHDHARQVARAREGEHRRGQALVAGGDAEDARPPRQRADLAPHHDRRVVAIGQAVHHARRALRAPVAGVGAEGGEGKATRAADGLGRGPHQQAHLPVAGVVAEGDGPAVLAANAPEGAEDQVGRARRLRGVPAHAGVLGQAEEVAARPVAEHLGIDGKAACGAIGPRAHAARRRAGQDLIDARCAAGHSHGSPSSRGVTGDYNRTVVPPFFAT